MGRLAQSFTRPLSLGPAPLSLMWLLSKLAFLAAAVFAGLLVFSVSGGIPFGAAALFCIALGLLLT